MSKDNTVEQVQIHTIGGKAIMDNELDLIDFDFVPIYKRQFLAQYILNPYIRDIWVNGGNINFLMLGKVL